jgi:hypothetical protein
MPGDSKAHFEARDVAPPDHESKDSKAHFESRDVAPPTYDPADTKNPKKYMGPERRRENRRGGHDRRQDVRFELNKEDRRQRSGRRHDDKAPKFW